MTTRSASVSSDGSSCDSLTTGRCESVPGSIELGRCDDLLHLQRLACSLTDASPAATKAAVAVLQCSRLIDSANDIMSAAPRRAWPHPGVAARECFDCAAHFVKSLLALDLLPARPDIENGGGAMLRISIAEAAAVLTASIAACAKRAGHGMPPAVLSRWERSLFGPRADEETTRLTGICLPSAPSHGAAADGVTAADVDDRRAALVAAAQNAIPKRDFDSDCTAAEEVYCSPPPERADPPPELAAEEALPRVAAETVDMEKLRGAALALKKQQCPLSRGTADHPLPAWFAPAAWTCHHLLLGPKVATVADEVEAAITAALQQLHSATAPTETDGRPSEKDGADGQVSAVESVDAEITALDAELAKIKKAASQQLEAIRNGSDPEDFAKLERVCTEQLEAFGARTVELRNKRKAVVAVMTAKDAYCNALLDHARDTADARVDSALQTVLVSNPPTAIPKPVTPTITGRCPVRTSLLSAVTAFDGVSCLSAVNVQTVLFRAQTNPKGRAQCGWWEVDEATAPWGALRFLLKEMQSQRMLLETCHRCGAVGKCVIHEGCAECGVEDLPLLEVKALIIPHTASNLLETNDLIRQCDTTNCRWSNELAGHLADGHNVLFLSACLEELFARGALVFVKTGPPECEFYRVRAEPGLNARFTDIDRDFQLRSLLTRPKDWRGYVPWANVLDGLLIDLTRPHCAKAVRRPVCGEKTLQRIHVPRVSHRYLELHARAHRVRHHALLHHRFRLHRYLLSREAAVPKLPPRYNTEVVNPESAGGAAATEDVDASLQQWFHGLVRLWNV